ncbi:MULTISPECIES: heat-inducible transcriptional repressor HrcA [Peptoniphilus]|uniref:heat-inducible transcriptional repressor HrcA n=1 Tax=Peptoniphilus TaxID=162289 RepID=UPI0002DB423C|nr:MULTISPECIES: heat-inducible transcriptional repressor HrcA [Peptoniphilus]
MDERKIEILNAIINSYIDSPNPVGSRTISKDFNLGISSATVRNEMADLEDLGYLNKPHTSAGRIPSNKAYRFFVDHIQKEIFEYDIDFIEDYDIRDLILQNANSLDDIFKNTVKLLSDFTKCTSYVVALKKPDTEIKFIQLLNIDEYSILLLIVGNRGVVEKQIVNTQVSISDDDLHEICKKLNEYLCGIDFQKIGGLKVVLKGSMVKYGEFISDIIKRASTFNEKVSQFDFYYDGLNNILSFEEYYDIEKARNFIKFIEDKKSILKLINYSEKSDFDVIIGDENEDELMKNNSIIRATFRPKNQRIGQIGIIGPIRMDYRKHIKTVKLFRDNLSYVIDKIVR